MWSKSSSRDEGPSRRNKRSTSYHQNKSHWTPGRAIRFNLPSSSSPIPSTTLQYIIILLICSKCTSGQQYPSFGVNPQPPTPNAIAIPVPPGVNPQDIVPVPIPTQNGQWSPQGQFQQQPFQQQQNPQFQQYPQQSYQNQQPQYQQFAQPQQQFVQQPQQPQPMSSSDPSGSSGPSGPGGVIPIPPLPPGQLPNVQFSSGPSNIGQQAGGQAPVGKRQGGGIPDQGFDHPYGDGNVQGIDTSDPSELIEAGRGVFSNIMSKAATAFMTPLKMFSNQAAQIASSGSQIVPQVLQNSLPAGVLSSLGGGKTESGNFHPVKMTQMNRPPPPPNFPLYDMPKEGFATPPPPPIMHPMANMPTTYYSTTNFYDTQGSGSAPEPTKNRIGPMDGHGGPRKKGPRGRRPRPPPPPPPQGKKPHGGRRGKRPPGKGPRPGPPGKGGPPQQAMTQLNNFEGYDDPMATNIHQAVSPPLGRPLGFEEYMKRPSHSFTQDPWNFDPLANELNQGMNTYGLKYNYDPLGMMVLEPGQTHLDESKMSYLGDFYAKDSVKDGVPSAQIGGWDIAASSWDTQARMEREKEKQRSQSQHRHQSKGSQRPSSSDSLSGGSDAYEKYDKYPHRHQPHAHNRRLPSGSGEKVDPQFDPISMLANAGIEIDLGDLSPSASTKDTKDSRARSRDRERERERERDRERRYRERERAERRERERARERIREKEREKARESRRREEYASRNKVSDSYNPYNEEAWTNNRDTDRVRSREPESRYRDRGEERRYSRRIAPEDSLMILRGILSPRVLPFDPQVKERRSRLVGGTTTDINERNKYYLVERLIRAMRQ